MKCNLACLGAVAVPRHRFVAEVARLVRGPAPSWTLDSDLSVL